MPALPARHCTGRLAWDSDRAGEEEVRVTVEREMTRSRGRGVACSWTGHSQDMGRDTRGDTRFTIHIGVTDYTNIQRETYCWIHERETYYRIHIGVTYHTNIPKEICC